MKRTTLCYIERDNQYLMLYRNKKNNDENAGKWIGIGGKFLNNETPSECLLREVYEETKLLLKEYAFRGLIRFVSDIYETEYMYLYTATISKEDVPASCDEGELHWISKNKVISLPIWEGDKAIFKALEDEKDFFFMELIYQGEALINRPFCIHSPLKAIYELQDKKYKSFQASLVPTIAPVSIIGVRIPALRRLAKAYIKTPECREYLSNLPHIFYDENIFHSILLSEIKDYDECIELVEKFLPFIDNWAVCDILSPRIFRKNSPAIIKKIQEWIASPLPYTCRFGVKMLMDHFLDLNFDKSILQLPADIKILSFEDASDKYYVQMAIAWFYATALAKKWEEALPYLQDKRLEPWIHNKAIQKARESYRISDERKEYLKSMKL